jgi:hypothetical protein
MTVEWKEDKVKKISKMGFYELMDYKEDIIASQVENPTKFFLYDIIDERLLALDAEGAAVICDDSSFETMDWSER